MTNTRTRNPRVGESDRHRLAVLLGICALILPGSAWADPLDICGCAASGNSLGDFDDNVPATYPPGTTTASSTIRIPLPPDGVLIFDSMTIDNFWVVDFTPNAANTPVTLLVKGDVTIAAGSIRVDGEVGTSGTDGAAGGGGLPGPGGFRGGDAAYENSNGASDGGKGLGPAGGAAGSAVPLAGGGNGDFLGTNQLRPALGGSGGGGGASSDIAIGCAGGGGGGGAGALLIAVNGTLAIGANGAIRAVGGAGGRRDDSTCSTPGGAGSGGAIRLIAHTIEGVGSGYGSIIATGGLGQTGGNGTAASGKIRMEALFNTFTAATQLVNPVASRDTVPGPISNPFTPTVAITEVDGALVPDPPSGGLGGIDVIVPAPGDVQIDLETSGVPVGTLVDVRVKPRVGGDGAEQSVALTGGICNGSGDCFPSATFALAAGAYFIEAQATFEAAP